MIDVSSLREEHMVTDFRKYRAFHNVLRDYNHL
jgi:hypothetical protein